MDRTGLAAGIVVTHMLSLRPCCRVPHTRSEVLAPLPQRQTSSTRQNESFQNVIFAGMGSNETPACISATWPGLARAPLSSCRLALVHCSRHVGRGGAADAAVGLEGASGGQRYRRRCTWVRARARSPGRLLTARSRRRPAPVRPQGAQAAAVLATARTQMATAPAAAAAAPTSGGSLAAPPPPTRAAPHRPGAPSTGGWKKPVHRDVSAEETAVLKCARCGYARVLR